MIDYDKALIFKSKASEKHGKAVTGYEIGSIEFPVIGNEHHAQTLKRGAEKLHSIDSSITSLIAYELAHEITR